MMAPVAVSFRDERLDYTGRELRPHFLLERFGMRGNAIAAFVGACRVETADLVDWEDRLAADHIQAREMVHFIGEFFGLGLDTGIFLQRLMVASVVDSLRERGLQAVRSGDDVFVGGRKLSVSIVTATPVSQLLHLGINVDPEGAPVAAVGLRELGVEPAAWSKALLAAFAEELQSIAWAGAKVRPVC